MAEQQDQVHVPVFHQEPENQVTNVFFNEIHDAFITIAPIQEWQNLLSQAPPDVPIEVYYKCAVIATLGENARARHFPMDFPPVDFDPRLDVLRLMLLENKPEIASHKSQEGLLLHKAVDGQDSNVEAIQLIVVANPNAMFETCERQYYTPLTMQKVTPLYMACWKGAVDIVRLLLEQGPGAASISGGRHGELPTHLTLRRQLDERVILGLLDAYEGAASIKGDYGQLPLHLVNHYNCSIELVKRLVEIYPEGVSVRSNYGNLPLHCACHQVDGISLDIINFLLDKYPEGIRARNSDGQLPLHIAVDNPYAALELIEYLIGRDRDAVNVTDHNGDLPLHFACEWVVSFDVLQVLLDCTGDETNHRGLSVGNNLGQLPLHSCCASLVDRPDTHAALQELLNLYPEGIRTVDTNGFLPLHAACGQGFISLNDIRLLLEADPYTVVRSTQNEHGQTPWRERDLEILAFLIEKQNEAVANLKEAHDHVLNQLGMPDLVVALMWSFAMPDLWEPPVHD